MANESQVNKRYDVTIHCNHPDEIIQAIGDAAIRLPKEMRRALNRIMVQLLSQVGKKGLYERCNGRTIALLLKEFESYASTKPLKHGQLEGITFTLFEKPESPEE